MNIGVDVKGSVVNHYGTLIQHHIAGNHCTSHVNDCTSVYRVLHAPRAPRQGRRRGGARDPAPRAFASLTSRDTTYILVKCNNCTLSPTLLFIAGCGDCGATYGCTRTPSELLANTICPHAELLYKKPTQT